MTAARKGRDDTPSIPDYRRNGAITADLPTITYSAPVPDGSYNYQRVITGSKPWIDGAGWIGALAGSGNGDIYVGNDGIHPNREGHAYLRDNLVPKLQTIINDDGTLEGSTV